LCRAFGGAIVGAPPLRRTEAPLELSLAEIPLALWIGAALAFYMAWAIGANDVANAMGTSVGSGSLHLRGAIVVAGAMEFAGAFLAGGHVTKTVRKGMLDMDVVSAQPEVLLYGMLAALAAAATLLVIATYFGLPISTTHSIVGAIIGFGAVGLGVDAVNWGKVSQIVLSWGTSPLIGGVLGFSVFTLIRKLILDREDPLEAARRHGPFFFGFVFFILGLVTLFKGLKNLKLDFSFGEALGLSLVLGLVGVGFGWVVLGRVYRKAVAAKDDETPLMSTERVFVILNILTAAAVCFAHGSNDVANSIGPLAAVAGVVKGGVAVTEAAVEPWMLALGGVGIVIGLGTWGYRVIETIGHKITQLTPSRGFSAELGAATTIVLASRMGIPVSTTHILVGAVLGVGLSRGIGALDLRVVGNILLSWVATLPLAAGLSILFFHLFRALLSS
jgi:PiT family inorganic phosphate transporter